MEGEFMRGIISECIIIHVVLMKNNPSLTEIKAGLTLGSLAK